MITINNYLNVFLLTHFLSKIRLKESCKSSSPMLWNVFSNNSYTRYRTRAYTPSHSAVYHERREESDNVETWGPAPHLNSVLIEVYMDLTNNLLEN